MLNVDGETFGALTILRLVAFFPSQLSKQLFWRGEPVVD
jgi:hypothetical protein